MNTGTSPIRATRLLVALIGVLVVLALVAAAYALFGGARPFGDGEIPARPGQQLWRTDGYGMIMSLEGDTLTFYQVTSISCIPGESATRTGSADATGTQTFGSDGSAEYQLRPKPDGSAVYHEIGTVSDIDLIPVTGLPGSCGRKLPKDPLTTFDVFWTTFAENYNSLHRRGVDWQAMRDKYRPMVDEDTSKKELFGILRSMLQPLGDMHTGLTTGNPDDEDSDGKEFEGKRSGTEDISAKKTDKATDAFLTSQGATGFQTFGQGKLVYADLPGNKGYLRIDAFEELDKKDDFVAAEAEVQRMLNAVFTAPRVAGLQMLVIDVRNNPGGEDALGLDIAARLTDQRYPAYTKAARNDPNNPDSHARAQTVTVEPAAGPRYTGPIRMLTGPLTISAGETFTLAMMGRTPAPERFGENTQGVYSDTLARKLPNGWTATLGNEEFTTPDGQSYEGKGIPPTTRLPVYPEAELDAGQDSVLAAALR